MQARIYRPARTAMQSGPAGLAKSWVLEYEPQSPKRPDHLMGWLGSNDIASQITLKFHTVDEAVAYAKRHNLNYEVQAEPKTPFRAKNYADNFKSDKLEFGRF
jgi:ETC complex I subunit conserved region